MAVRGSMMMRARVVCTTRPDGDFNADLVAPAVLAERRRAVVDLPWTWLDEVHGREVVTVARPGDGAGSIADALVTAIPGAAISVWVGDCAPVALVGRDHDDAVGVIGVAHAGWRGLRDGVLEATVGQMRRLGASHIEATIGPHIHACCYEFGSDDLSTMTERFGPMARSVSSAGSPALDMSAAIARALGDLDVSVESVGPCTGCHGGRYWSHRARGERGRQAMVVWMEEW